MVEEEEDEEGETAPMDADTVGGARDEMDEGDQEDGDDMDMDKDSQVNGS